MKAKISLNTMTLDQKIRAIKEAGYQGIGLWKGDIRGFLKEGGTLDGYKKMLADNGLEPAEICFVGDWQWEEGEARKVAFDKAKEAFEWAQGIGLREVIACVSGAKGDLARGADDYGDLCDLAAPFGVCPALEFTGGAQTINDIGTAWKVMQMVNRPNAGILLDTFHFIKGESKMEDLEALPPGAVACVHINDAPDWPLEKLSDGDRVMPGKGAIPLDKILGALKRKGYEGFLSLELFSEELWAKDPFEVAKMGAEALKKIVSAV